MLKKLNHFIRRMQTYELPDSLFMSNKRLSDIILESILPSPHRLVNDIIQRLKNGEDFFSYSKSDIMRLSDKSWTFYDEVSKFDERFHLRVIRCNENQLIASNRWLSDAKGWMMEFGNPSDPNEESIWISSLNDSYDIGFKNLLVHELGHVWTFSIGSRNDDFKVGHGPSSIHKVLDPRHFTDYQKDVFIAFYRNDLKILRFDFSYILCKADENDTADYELPAHIDNIIEILVNDYLNFNVEMEPEVYLHRMFSFLKGKIDADSDISIIKLYRGELILDGYCNESSVKNPIRRLFLIFAFGTDAQIEYFKDACEEEFGRIS